MSKDFLNKKINLNDDSQSEEINRPLNENDLTQNILATDEEQSETRNFQLNEFKEELAKEELNAGFTETTSSSDYGTIQKVIDTPNETDAVQAGETLGSAESEVDWKAKQEIRRQYWQEKQVQDDLEKRPFHRYPNYFYAGFWLRLFAYLVDLLVIQSLGRIAVNNMFTAFQLPKDSASFSFYTLAHLAVYLLYFILMTKLTNGQTLGKMIFGLRVVCFKEENLSWGTVLIREGFCRYFLQVAIFGYSVMQFLYLVLLFTPQKQHVGDILSDTSVVSENVLKASKLEAA